MNSRIAKIAIAAAVVIAVLIGLHYLGGSPIETSVAWADVVARMDAAQTVTFALESENQYEPGDCDWGKGTVRIKTPYRRFDGTYCHRYADGPIHEDTTISIMDLSRQNRFILLHPAQKMGFYAPDHGFSDALMTYDGIKKDFRNGTEESLGTAQINGRDTVCFKVSIGDKTITVWADPKTALPLRIEQIAKGGKSKIILSDIAFDLELGDDLFDMTPPKNYCVMNMATDEFTIPFELTQEHLIGALTTSAKSLGGRFPTLFKGGRPGKEARDKSRTESMQAAPVEGSTDPLLGTEFVKRLPKDNGWQYVGEDVKLGDTTKAVCWWKPAGSQTYRVVYGDLSIRDVEPKDLPAIPWLAQQK